MNLHIGLFKAPVEVCVRILAYFSEREDGTRLVAEWEWWRRCKDAQISRRAGVQDNTAIGNRFEI